MLKREVTRRGIFFLPFFFVGCFNLKLLHGSLEFE